MTGLLLRLAAVVLGLLLVDAPTWRFGSLNAPQATRGAKAKLLRWPHRGRALEALTRRHKIDALGLQEVGPRTLAAVRGIRGVLLMLARANTVRGRFRVGNGALISLATFEVLHRRLLVAWNRYGPRFLPIYLLADNHTADRVVFMPGHADRKRPSAGPGKRVLRAMAREGARLHELTGVPVVVAIDTNNAPAAIAIFEEYGFVILAREGIDLVAGLGVDGVGKQLELRGYAGVVTDHGNPAAADARPTSRNFTLNRIPQLSRSARALLKRARPSKRRNRR